MSELGDIEAAVVGLIGGIEVGGSALFASVRGASGTTARGVVEILRRERKPAAGVVYEGRGAGDKYGMPDEPVFSVYCVVESLRGGDEPRRGSALVSGGFDALSELVKALAGAVILTVRQLGYVDERLVAADERSVVYQQRYKVFSLPTTTAPTFDGVAICGTDSVVRVQVGELRQSVNRFSFPGVDAVFQQVLGLRNRPIVWSGQLRAATNSALNAIESNLESLVAKSVSASMSDGLGRSFGNCVPVQYRRWGLRGKHTTTGQALQSFDMEFSQLKA